MSSILNDYTIILASIVGIQLILAQSFNLSFGLGSLLNLAHIAFYAVGAYSTALLTVDAGFSFGASIIVGMALSALLALLLGLIALRLSSDYYAIGTLAFHAIIAALLINWRSLTRGVLGVPGIERPEIFGFQTNSEWSFAVLVWGCVLLSFLFLRLFFAGSFGRLLRAQGENELSSLAIGVDVVKVRITALVVSSIGAAFAGSLFACYLRYIDPSSFQLNEMIFVLTVVVLGRPGSFWGVAAATAFLVLLPEPLRFLEIRSDILGPMRQLIYALILFGSVYWNRKRLFPALRRV